MSDVPNEASYRRFNRRVTWIIAALGLAGALAAEFVPRDTGTGLAFLIGAVISFTSFLGLADVWWIALGPNPRKRSRSFFVLRLIGLSGVGLRYNQISSTERSCRALLGCLFRGRRSFSKSSRTLWELTAN